KDTDETFIVIEGDLRIDFRNGAVHIRAGEMFVVPKGVEHKPYAENEVKLLLIEPRGVLNTGDVVGERTAEQDVWICTPLVHQRCGLNPGRISPELQSNRREERHPIRHHTSAVVPHLEGRAMIGF